MAIVINSIPTNPARLSDPLLYNVTMTGLVNGTIISRFGYQLFNGTDPVTSEEVLSPVEGVPFNVWFRDDVKSEVYTKAPQCDNVVVEESEMVASVNLKFFEQLFDTDTCTPSTSGEGNSTPFTILNSVNKYWGALPSSAAYTSLSYLPETMVQHVKCKQWYYVYTQTPLAFEVNLYQSDGTLEFSKQGATTSGANSILIDPTALAEEKAGGGGMPAVTTEEILSRAGRIELLLGPALGPKDTLVTIHFGGCCGPQIAFQSFAGGYAMMCMDTETTRKIKSTSTEICRFKVPQSYPNSQDIQNGFQSVGKTSTKDITFTKVLTQDDLEDIRFYESFLESGSYFLFFDDINGDEQMVRFKVSGGSVTYSDEDNVIELRITGSPMVENFQPNNLI